MKIKSKDIAVAMIGALFITATSEAVAGERDDVCRVQRMHGQVWQSFALKDVRLTDSYFKKAMDLDHRYLLQLEVDRLIPHVRRNVGLQPKGQNYGGWETHGGCTYGPS
ncbi:MAG: beta-L-arabinofuranosidase domain-containing protein [Prevotella sp.]